MARPCLPHPRAGGPLIVNGPWLTEQRPLYNPFKDLLAPLSRIDHAYREILFASLFLVLWLIIGTLGYAIIEDWTLMDGFYMTFITLTTIGFGEVKTLSTAGRVSTIFIAIVGIGSVAFVAAWSAQLLLAGHLLRQRQIARRIRHIHARPLHHLRIWTHRPARGRRLATRRKGIRGHRP